MTLRLCFTLLLLFTITNASLRSRLQDQLFGIGPQLSVHVSTPIEKGFGFPSLPEIPDLPDIPSFPQFTSMFEGAQELSEAFESQNTREAISQALNGDFEPARALIENGMFDAAFDAMNFHPDTSSIIETVESWMEHDPIAHVAQLISDGRGFISSLRTLVENPETMDAILDLVLTRDFQAFLNRLDELYGQAQEQNDDQDEVMCCAAITPECQACSRNISVEEFCRQCSSGSNDLACDGCADVEEEVCCTAMTLECRACSSGISVAEFCRQCQEGSNDLVCDECMEQTPCEIRRMLSTGLLGAYAPRCEDDGSFSALQCHTSTGQCWCADEDGEEIEGTRVGPMSEVQLDCQAERQNQLSECELQASQTGGLLGAFRPRCNEDGSYRPLQCRSSTGYCWCVDVHGHEIEGTRSPPGSPPTCENHTYDCYTLEQWSEAKSHWCCENEQVRCDANGEKEEITVDVGSQTC